MIEKQYRCKRRTQRIFGILLMGLSILILIMASQAITLEESDGTAALLTAPLGLALLFSKKILIR